MELPLMRPSGFQRSADGFHLGIHFRVTPNGPGSPSVKVNNW
jgi:hypothetical protein